MVILSLRVRPNRVQNVFLPASRMIRAPALKCWPKPTHWPFVGWLYCFQKNEARSTFLQVSEKFIEDLETLIRARYPIIYIVSPEETRVQTLLSRVAEKRQKNLFEWSCTTGMAPADALLQVQRTKHSATR